MPNVELVLTITSSQNKKILFFSSENDNFSSENDHPLLPNFSSNRQQARNR